MAEINKDLENDIELKILDNNNLKGLGKSKSKIFLENIISFTKMYKKITIAILISFILLLSILLIILLQKRGVERFYPILPAFIKPNSLGYFESNKNGLEDIPKEKMIYKREESSYLQKIEQMQMSNIEGDIESSIQADITIFHCKSNFNAQINNVIKTKNSFIYYIIKYIYGSITLKTEDIKLNKYFLEKINKIADEKNTNDKKKAIELDKLFDSYGFYVPQKIYLGASYITQIDSSQSSKANIIDGKVSLGDDKKAEAGYTKKSIIDFLNKQAKTNIIGGNKYAENYEDWKSSINEDNMEIIGYDNFLEVTHLLDYQLKMKLQYPLIYIENKYQQRKEYYKIIQDLKEITKKDKTGGGSSTQGLCNKDRSNLIYSKNIDVDESWKFGDSILNYHNSFTDIIVGWKIKSLANLNGSWTVKGNPILKHEISITFKRTAKVFGIGYDIEIFLMKEPELE